MPLKISVRSVLPSREVGDLVVVGLPTSYRSTKKNQRSPFDGFDRALGGALAKLMKRDDFKGKKDEVFAVATLGRSKAGDELVLMGLGDARALTAADVRTFAARAARMAQKGKAKRLVLGIPGELGAWLRPLAEGLELGAYRFTKYLTGPRAPKSELTQVTICITGDAPATAKRDVDAGQALAAGVNLARDLSNEPGNVIYPESLADVAKAMSKDVGLQVTHLDFKEIQRRGMGLLQAVGQGSDRKPCLVHMAYKPAGARKRLVFVGKGVTFDSGGISIKPAADMGEMKHDMSGAANVVGLMSAVGRLKPDVEVHGIFVAAENMPDGGAYRPGDVWPTLDGKTVEIINTDAEGRLILADAFAYARELQPDVMVDNATLTGAMVVALSHGCSGFFASNDDVATLFTSAVTASGERMWRMPLLEELKEELKSDVADLKHTGSRWGGSISAALFLREFIGDVKNWVHCDIAGPAMGERPRGWDPRGGTGHGVLTFFSLIEQVSRDAIASGAPALAHVPAAAVEKARPTDPPAPKTAARKTGARAAAKAAPPAAESTAKVVAKAVKVAAKAAPSAKAPVKAVPAPAKAAPKTAAKVRRNKR